MNDWSPTKVHSKKTFMKNQWKGGGQPKKVITWTYDDLAKILGYSPVYIRRLILNKQLVLTGDPLIDFEILTEWYLSRS